MRCQCIARELGFLPPWVQPDGSTVCAVEDEVVLGLALLDRPAIFVRNHVLHVGVGVWPRAEFAPRHAANAAFCALTATAVVCALDDIQHRLVRQLEQHIAPIPLSLLRHVEVIPCARGVVHQRRNPHSTIWQHFDRDCGLRIVPARLLHLESKPLQRRVVLLPVP